MKYRGKVHQADLIKTLSKMRKHQVCKGHRTEINVEPKYYQEHETQYFINSHIISIWA